MVVAKVIEEDAAAPYTLAVDGIEGWAAEWSDPEKEDEFTGKLIEIQGLSGPVVAENLVEGTQFEVDGAAANGMKGRAALSADGTTYVVETLDGDVLYVPKANLSVCSGGLQLTQGSLVWEDGSFPFHVVAQAVTQVRYYGYSVIQTPGVNGKRALEDILNHVGNSVQPKADFSEALGLGFGEEFTWLQAKQGEEAFESVMDFCSAIAPFAPREFGFVAAATPAFKMLRKLRPGAMKSPTIDPSDDTANFLDFVQRRRLGIISIKQGSAEVQLSSRQSSTAEVVKVSLEVDSLFVFRNDMFSYSIHATQTPAVALQSWLVKEQSKVEILEIEGSMYDVCDLIGTTSNFVRGADEIHVASAACIAGGNVTDLDKICAMYTMATDTFVEVPTERWDHSYYYTPEYEGGGAVTKHGGFCSTAYLMSFDHDFFGATYEDSAKLTFTAYKLLEMSYNALHDVGFTKETLKGQYIHHYCADGSHESESNVRVVPEKSADIWTPYYLQPQIVAHMLGLTGKAVHVDTACSASNVAMNALYQEMLQIRDHSKYGFAEIGQKQDECRTGMISGNSCLVNPNTFVGLSQGRMLGKRGRCETFNASAGGFARGEGYGVIVCQNRSEIKYTQYQMMAVIGGNTNQDGRSASLTAPNGPSQSAVIRASQRAANVDPADVSICELHGTGTALGDPIEVGSLQAVMMGREVPLPYCAGKSNTGHHELGAGIAGFLKTYVTFKFATSPSNVHLRMLNPNVDAAGYPALWAQEGVDVHLENFLSGVSSFGFGGTNSRTEFWGRCTHGPSSVSPFSMLPDGSGAVANVQRSQGRALNFEGISICTVACPECKKPMCLMCKETLPGKTAQTHVCSKVRNESDRYAVCSDCYKGDYIRGFASED